MSVPSQTEQSRESIVWEKAAVKRTPPLPVAEIANRMKAISSEVRAWLTPSGRILEMARGITHSEYAAHLTGVEPTANGIEMARDALQREGWMRVYFRGSTQERNIVLESRFGVAPSGPKLSPEAFTRDIVTDAQRDVICDAMNYAKYDDLLLESQDGIYTLEGCAGEGLSAQSVREFLADPAAQ